MNEQQPGEARLELASHRWLPTLFKPECFQVILKEDLKKMVLKGTATEAS